MNEDSKMSNEDVHRNLGHNALRAEIVTTAEQLFQVFAIRSLAFMEDTGIPYDHAFDRNDFQSTHVILYDGTEPVGGLRIRWFKDFAKLERTGTRKTYRGMHSLKVLLDFAFAHIAQKGYTQAITHASPTFARLWRMQFGFKAIPGKAPAYYHGGKEEYVELVRYLDVPSDAVTLSSSAAVLLRIEGAWGIPVQYEAS